MVERIINLIFWTAFMFGIIFVVYLINSNPVNQRHPFVAMLLGALGVLITIVVFGCLIVKTIWREKEEKIEIAMRKSIDLF
jgi:hypothetical protein